MTRTRLIALAALFAAACSSGPPAVAAGAERIGCALGGADRFAQSCSIERVQQGSRRLLVVHHPDGGFRRFELSADGRDLIAADGADKAVLALAGKAVVVRVDTDAYRFVRPFAGRVAGR